MDGSKENCKRVDKQTDFKIKPLAVSSKVTFTNLAINESSSQLLYLCLAYATTLHFSTSFVSKVGTRLSGLDSIAGYHEIAQGIEGLR